MGSIVKIVVDPWEEVTNGKLISALVCMGILVLFLLVSEKGFVPVLDYANLAFHEAGHLFFGLLGSTAELYGGTLGQLFFPAVAVGSFLVEASAGFVCACRRLVFRKLLQHSPVHG